VRRQAAWLLGRSGRLAGALPAGGRPGSARVSSALLGRVADGRADAARRERYTVLLEALRGAVPELDRLPAGASPFGVPVAAPDKAGLLGRLLRANVHALDFWSTPHPTLRIDAFPGAAARRATTVALPVHQELRPQVVQQLARGVRGDAQRRAGAPKA
jgi:hypothetical protein